MCPMDCTGPQAMKHEQCSAHSCLVEVPQPPRSILIMDLTVLGGPALALLDRALDYLQAEPLLTSLRLARRRLWSVCRRCARQR